MKPVLCSLLVTSLAATSTYAQLSAPIKEPATVHFYQNRIYGFLYPKLRVYADGKLVCKLGRNSHGQVSLPAGTTTFTARIPVFTPGKPVPLALPLESGKEYYLEGGFATESVIPGLSYGLTEVVANASKRAQIAQAKPALVVVSTAP
ncbi:hypothetical protein DNI29_21755 [Hymenobacter sediminis]|uniref:hypothetical protein n=1 Tax=Hymenobacter sediminis TaxID=2218621 RepID=UPI000DA6AFCB|nr:hypothetical protein [Hymenobacter sediminis]RPD44334.1 hypothetical protein DNI29_21755 [Hymenobacter sediminis]